MEHRESKRGQWEVCTAVAVYLVLLAVSWQSGYRMEVVWDYPHLLPRDALTDRLAESLFYLHAQPPLMNLELGLALKTGRVLGIDYTHLLFGVHVTLGVVAVYAYTRLCQHLVASAWLRTLAITLFVLHPVLYASLFNFFYTFYEVVLLALLGAVVFSYARTRSTFDYGWICILVVLLSGTRALFHFAWGLVVLIGLLFLCRSDSENEDAQTRPRSSGQIAWAVGATLLLFAWPLKNGLLFDSYSPSSWTGYSLALELPGTGTFTSLDIDRLPPRDWSVPERFASIPVLSERTKANRQPNWNHYAILNHSRNQGRLALSTLQKNPLALAQKARLNYWNYTRFSGRDPYTGIYGLYGAPFPAVLTPWIRGYETVSHLDLRKKEDVAHRFFRILFEDGTRGLAFGHSYESAPQSWALSGFALLFPVLIIAAAVMIARSRPFAPEESLTALFMLFCVVWVLLLALFVDGTEGNRIRFSTESYVFLLAIWSLDCHRRLRARPKRDSTTPQTRVRTERD